MNKVLVPLGNGFEEIEAVSIIDVLRRAGVNSIIIKTDLTITDVKSDELDMIVLPGGWGGTHALADNKYVQNILKEMDKKGKNIGAICAAPFALNKAGVLKDRYTCYPSVQNDIKRDGYQGDKDMVVEDKNIMTSRGPATAICFALAIVKKLKDEKTYNDVKSGILADFCK